MHFIYAHLIGDYLLQTDKMALNKKYSDLWCLIHVLTYMLPFVFTNINIYGLIFIAIQHYFQDRYNFVVWFMKVKGSSNFATNFGPWSIILTDNIIHILFIALISTYFCR
jgi:hypothetical protein